MRGATTAATDTAQIVLMGERLRELPFLFSLGHEFDSNMKAGFASAIIPGMGIIAGAYLFHLGIAGSIIIWNLSLFTGVGIASWPLLKHRRIESQSK